MACFPNILSLLAGKVGLKRWALVKSTNFAAAGLEIITQGQPRMWVLKIDPNLYQLQTQETNSVTHLTRD